MTERPVNATLWKLYALYKQASEGGKWEAWNSIKNTPSAHAMQQYAALIESLG